MPIPHTITIERHGVQFKVSGKWFDDGSNDFEVDSVTHNDGDVWPALGDTPFGEMLAKEAREKVALIEAVIKNNGGFRG